MLMFTSAWSVLGRAQRGTTTLPLFQGAAANLNPWTEAKVDTDNPDRGPMLLIAGGAIWSFSPAITRACYKHQQRNPGVTKMAQTGPAGS